MIDKDLVRMKTVAYNKCLTALRFNIDLEKFKNFCYGKKYKMQDIIKNVFLSNNEFNNWYSVYKNDNSLYIYDDFVIYCKEKGLMAGFTIKKIFSDYIPFKKYLNK